MSQGGRKGRRAWCSLTAVVFVLAIPACSGSAGRVTTSTAAPVTTTTTTAGPASTTTRAPELTDQQEVELQARAVARAFHGPRFCMAEDNASAELRAALAPLFEEVLYVEAVNFASGVGWDHCRWVSVAPARWLAAEVAGVDVWILDSPLSGIGETFLFRWDGTAWVEATPEETGVTVTTAVS